MNTISAHPIRLTAMTAFVALFAAGTITGANAAEPSAEVMSSTASAGVDTNLPPYQPVTGISGTMVSVGSDTLNNLMTMWAEEFVGHYPNVKPEIEGKGSGTAPTALIGGTAQFGPMSREMKAEEAEQFQSKFGYKPTKIAVAIDGLAVFVHKDNPLTSLTMTQVDSLFSSTFKGGGTDITMWSQLGLSAWGDKKVSLYGRDSVSGTYVFFKENALKKGDYKKTTQEQKGSSAVVTAVANDTAGIGYSGIGYITAGVKALPLATGKGQPVAPNYESCLSGDYPLARFLYVYVNKAPNKPLPALTKQFMTFVLSKDGQDDVRKDGYFPLTAELAAQQRLLLGE